MKPTDEVKFNDSRVQGEKKVYLVLNKPKGYVTSLDDPHAGKTVMELVKGPARSASTRWGASTRTAWACCSSPMTAT